MWRVYHSLTEPVPYSFVSVNRRNNEAAGPRCNVGPRFVIPSIYGWIQTYTKPVPLKCRKLAATKYPWIYGYFYSVLVTASAIVELARVQRNKV